MLDYIKHIINKFLVKCFANYYDVEVITIKRISSTGSFIEYESDCE